MSDTPKTDKLAKCESVPDGVWIRHARELGTRREGKDKNAPTLVAYKGRR